MKKDLESKIFELFGFVFYFLCFKSKKYIFVTWYVDNCQQGGFIQQIQILVKSRVRISKLVF